MNKRKTIPWTRPDDDPREIQGTTKPGNPRDNQTGTTKTYKSWEEHEAREWGEPKGELYHPQENQYF